MQAYLYVGDLANQPKPDSGPGDFSHTTPPAPVKILVVEDEMIIAANMAMQLTSLGYAVTGILAQGSEAIRHVADYRPDIVLLDINLKGHLDGIETAHVLHQTTAIPIIYVTANNDEATFNRAKATHPYAFIVKPVRNVDLQRTIELTISLLTEKNQLVFESPTTPAEATPYVLNDRIFVRNRDRMTKIEMADILYIEADRNYCHIVTNAKAYTLATTLKVMEDKLPAGLFLRIHRSYLVNLTQVDEVTEGYVSLAGKTVPLSHLLRDELMKRIQTI